MSVHAWFIAEEVEVRPGATLALSLHVQNTQQRAETFAVVPTGPASSWTSAPQEETTVAAGETAVVPVIVTPPALPTTNAGPTTVAVRVIPQDERLELAADTTIDVAAFDERRIVALQPVQRSRRRATYEFMVENDGNNMASCRLRLLDLTDRVDGDFDPPAVGVPPGESSLVRLRARTRRNYFRRSTRTLEFEVEAEQQGHQPAQATFALVQPPTVPRGLFLGLLAVLALVAAAAAAWAWVVRPAIEDAAADEVDRLAEEVAAEATGTTTVATTSPATDTGAAPTAAEEDASTSADDEGGNDGGNGQGDDQSDGRTTTTTQDDNGGQSSGPAAGEGVPDFERLKVEAPLTQTADASFTVPRRQVFDLTDVRIENPFNDGGVATLLVNGEEVFLWSLENIRGSQFEPSITQKRLEGGDIVTFSVRCDVISDPFRSTCTNAVNVGGLVYRPNRN